MSVTLNLNEKKLNVPSNFFENETLSSGELNLDRKETYWNTNSLYTLPKILLKVRTIQPILTSEQSDINVIEVQKKGLHPKNFVYKLTKNSDKISSIPFLNLLLFEGNNTFVCYFYYSRNFNFPGINIIGEAEKIYVLYFYQNQTNSPYYDSLSIDDGSLSYESRVNCPECPKCPQCPKCPTFDCPLQSCPECPDIKPYTYGLYACGALIFVLLIFLSYLILKGNNEIKR